MIVESKRPRDTRLRPSGNQLSWETPCFEGSVGLRTETELATKVGLLPGLHLSDSKKRPTHYNDRIWIDNLARARTQVEINAASYSVLKRVHHILIAHETARLDQILKCASVERLPIQVLVGLLASSLKAKQYLVERSGFYERVEERLRREEPQRANGILRGLR